MAILLVCVVALPGQAGADGPAFTVADVTKSEGDGNADFTVSLTEPAPEGGVAFNYSTANESAVAPADYATTSGTLTIPVGETSATILVPIADDSINEGNETFTLTVTHTSNAPTHTARATITNNDTAPTITIADAAPVTEGGGPATFTVSISGTSSAPVTVSYTTENGSAAAPGDYTVTPGDLTWAPGNTDSKTISVPVVDDNDAEATETFRVRLTGSTGGSIGGSGFGTGTIRDNDQPTATIANATPNPGPAPGVKEGLDAVFAVTLSKASTIPVRVTYRTQDGTAVREADFENKPPGSFIDIPAGQTAGSIVVKTHEDTAAEGNESFVVALGDPNDTVRIGDPREGHATIIDNQALALSVEGGQVTEGDGDAVVLEFKVKLSEPSANAVEVTASTAGGTATGESDYLLKTERIQFSPGQVEKIFTIVVNGDTRDEPDETVLVDLTHPAGATIATARSSGTIVDNDNTSMLSIGDAEANEGAAGVSSTMTFKVTLAPASERTVSLGYATANGTAAGGSDYTETSGSLVFGPGETEKTVAVTVLGDDVNEANETLFVRLSGATGANVSDAEGQGTVVDKNAPPSLSIGDTVAREGGGASFTVQLAGTTLLPVTVGFATSDGNAREPGDYAARRGTLTFAPGEKTKTIDVSVVDDTLAEPIETFFVGLSDVVNGAITKSRGTATIEASDQVATSGTTAPPASPTLLPKMVLAPKTVNVTRTGFARLVLTCAKASPLVCRGSVTLQTTGKPPVKLGSKTFSVAKGKKQTLGVKLSPKARKLLAKRPTLRARVVVLVRTGAKSLRVVPGVITLKAAPKPAKKPKSTARPAP